MNAFNINKENKDGLFFFHYHPTDSELLIEKSFLNNSKVFEDWANSEDKSLYESLNLSNAGSGENLAVYLKIIQSLTTGCKLFGLSPWETALFANWNKKDYELVNWEYIIENEDPFTDQPRKIRNDFEPARSPQIMGNANPFPTIPTDKSGLFDLNNMQDVADLQKPGMGDVASLINIYALKHTTKLELLEFLRQSSKPKLHEFLKPGDLFISLLVGCDPGYYDYLLIASPSDISNSIEDIKVKYEEFAMKYESRIENISTLAELKEVLMHMP